MMYADAYLLDGTPVHFKCGRASGKSTLQLEMYMSLMSGLPIEEVRVAMSNMEKDDGSSQNQPLKGIDIHAKY